MATCFCKIHDFHHGRAQIELSLDGKAFEVVGSTGEDKTGTAHIFQGNHDASSSVQCLLPAPAHARCVAAVCRAGDLYAHRRVTCAIYMQVLDVVSQALILIYMCSYM
jgi:hypothetical protein